MENCRSARQIVEWDPHGKRRHGRPVNIWKNGRMGLGTMYKKETSRMKNDSIESSGGKILHLWVQNGVFRETLF
jgi:hypothetical protein